MERCGSQASRQVCDPPWGRRRPAASLSSHLVDKPLPRARCITHQGGQGTPWPARSLARSSVHCAPRSPAQPSPAAIRGAALAACRMGTVPSGLLSDRSQDTTMLSGHRTQNLSALDPPAAPEVETWIRLPRAPCGDTSEGQTLGCRATRSAGPPDVRASATSTFRARHLRSTRDQSSCLD